MDTLVPISPICSPLLSAVMCVELTLFELNFKQGASVHSTPPCMSGILVWHVESGLFIYTWGVVAFGRHLSFVFRLAFSLTEPSVVIHSSIAGIHSFDRRRQWHSSDTDTDTVAKTAPPVTQTQQQQQQRQQHQ